MSLLKVESGKEPLETNTELATNIIQHDLELQTQ